MKPARCTLLRSIFISTFLHVSGNYVPIIRRTYCIYATLVFCTLYGWLSGLLVGMSLIPTSSCGSRCKRSSIYYFLTVKILKRLENPFRCFPNASLLTSLRTNNPVTAVCRWKNNKNLVLQYYDKKVRSRLKLLRIDVYVHL